MKSKDVAIAFLISVLLPLLLVSCNRGEMVVSLAPTQVLTPVPSMIPTVAGVALPQPSATATPDLERSHELLVSLQKELEKELQPYGQTVAIAVTDLQTGETISVNGDVPFYPASTIKIIALFSVLKDVEDGLYPLADVEESIAAMMIYSDNTATDVLIDKTGFDRIGAIIERAGLTSTLFCHGFDYLAYACHMPNRTTAIDANRLWQALYDGKVLTGNYQTLALGYATLPEVRFIFAPEGFLVAHKPGYVDEYIADSGLVIDRNGVGYAVSFFSEGVGNAEGLAQQLTGAVFTWFFGDTQSNDGG